MFFFFCFSKVFSHGRNLNDRFLPHSTLELLFHCHQASSISNSNFINIVTFVLLHVMDIFLLAVFNFFLLITGFLKINYSMSFYVFFFCLLNFDKLWFHSFHRTWTIFHHFISRFFSALPVLLRPQLHLSLRLQYHLSLFIFKFANPLNFSFGVSNLLLGLIRWCQW